MKKTILFFCFLLFSRGLSAQQLDSIVAGLQRYTSTQSAEKLYLHFDKPFYSVGDTVWFKVYQVDAATNRLSSRSKVAYVDIRGAALPQRQLIIPIQMGMGSGQLVLHDSIYRAGNYALRAYTRWMQNESEDYFFHHTLKVGNAVVPVKGQASFREVSSGMESSLHYFMRNGEALSGRPVSYYLKRGDKILFSGKLFTDLSGKTGITFPKDKWSGEEVLETEVILTNGAAIRNRFSVKLPEAKLALDFFPEGGWLVSGIRSKVAFKALNKEGQSVPVKGYIQDDQGRQVALFTSGYGGMGVFSFLPEINRSYTAVVSEGLYEGQKQVLPVAKSTGYVLSVNPSGTDSLHVRVSRNAGPATTIHLIIQAHGTVQQALSLPITGNAIVFPLDKKKFAEGINQLTLFSSGFEPLAERLFFVHKTNVVQTVLQSDKPQYGPRERVKMELSVQDGKLKGIVGGYSAAVILADKAAIKEEQQLSIYASLLLRSDLRGNVENPNYYFTGYDEKKAAALDVLLLTQGWRRYSWKEVLSGQIPPVKFSAQEDLSIQGKVTDRGGRGVPGVKVNLLAAKQMLFLDTITNGDGHFHFKDLDVEDSVEVIIRARGLKDKDNVRITVQQPETPAAITQKEEFSDEASDPVDTAMNAYLTKTANLFEQMEKSGRIIQGTTLKEVEIVTKKKAPEIKGSVYPFAAAPPDYTFEPDKLQEMVNLETHLKGLMGIIVAGNKILGRNPKNIRKPIGPMVILLNGSIIEDLSGINPKALTGVQIIRGSTAASNMSDALMLNPALLTEYKQSPEYGIVFLTMDGIPDKFLKADRSEGLVQVALNGYHYAREFYAPRYETQKEKPSNDYRSTLFWKPDIITGEDGKVMFDFYTSDETGRYCITLEGIGANGELSRVITYFEVR